MKYSLYSSNSLFSANEKSSLHRFLNYLGNLVHIVRLDKLIYEVFLSVILYIKELKEATYE